MNSLTPSLRLTFLASLLIPSKLSSPVNSPIISCSRFFEHVLTKPSPPGSQEQLHKQHSHCNGCCCANIPRIRWKCEKGWDGNREENQNLLLHLLATPPWYCFRNICTIIWHAPMKKICTKQDPSFFYKNGGTLR